MLHLPSTGATLPGAVAVPLSQSVPQRVLDVAVVAVDPVPVTELVLVTVPSPAPPEEVPPPEEVLEVDGAWVGVSAEVAEPLVATLVVGSVDDPVVAAVADAVPPPVALPRVDPPAVALAPVGLDPPLPHPATPSAAAIKTAHAALRGPRRGSKRPRTTEGLRVPRAQG